MTHWLDKLSIAPTCTCSSYHCRIICEDENYLLRVNLQSKVICLDDLHLKHNFKRVGLLDMTKSLQYYQALFNILIIHKT